MKLDFFTLYLVILLVSLALAATWASIALQHRGFAPARIWLLGSLATCLGSALLPFQRSEVFPLVVSAAANTLPILGFWLIWIGTKKLHDAPSRLLPAFAMTLVCTILTIAFWRDPAALALIYALGQSLPMFLCTVFLVRNHIRSTGTALSLAGLGVALLAHLVVILINLWTMSGHPSSANLGSIATYTMLAIVFGGILWNFGLIVGSLHRLRDEVAELAELAHLDPLTGVWNRRKFELQIAAEEAMCRQGKPAYSLLMIDLDHFKLVNDSIGHEGGDAGLLHVVDCAKHCMRTGDQIARLGGDEFCILLPSTTAKVAELIGKDIVDAVARSPFAFKGHNISISCSMGIASWSEAHGDLKNHALGMADRAMYAVKRGGRNGVSFAPSG